MYRNMKTCAHVCICLYDCNTDHSLQLVLFKIPDLLCSHDEIPVYQLWRMVSIAQKVVNIHPKYELMEQVGNGDIKYAFR